MWRSGSPVTYDMVRGLFNGFVRNIGRAEGTSTSSFRVKLNNPRLEEALWAD